MYIMRKCAAVLLELLPAFADAYVMFTFYDKENIMDRKEVTVEQLKELKLGTFFQVPVWDSDDFHEWTFIYCKGRNGYIYLGGGLDNGTAVGKIETAEDVLIDVNECDFPYLSICEIKLSKK